MSRQWFLNFVLSAGLSVLVGALFGWLLGHLAPAFCVSIFGHGASSRVSGTKILTIINDQAFDEESFAMQLSVGFGMTCGFVVGSLVGSFFAFAEAIGSPKPKD